MNGVEKIKVRFEAGQSGHIVQNRQNGHAELDSCNYMLATVTNDEGDEIELYAEVLTSETSFDDFDPETEEFDWNGFDDYSYPILKEEIIKKAIENDIDPGRLEFLWG